jgi:hypothetical protein
LPSGSNSRTFGAGKQQSPVGGVCAAPISVRALKLVGRLMTKTWSRESTATPTADPSSQ